MSSLLNFHSLSEARKALHSFPPTVGSALDELKQMKIWICWNFKEKDGRRTKVPVSANGTATGTNEAYSHTWVTFDEAKTAAAEKHYSGVGFVIPKGWFFLDIDHRELQDPFVKTMLGRFDSYAEKSVSGEGIHIYGKCDFSKIPTVKGEGEKAARRLDSRYYLKNPQNGMELYIGGLTNRYAVFTGNMIHNKPLRDCTEAILMTLEKDMQKPPIASLSQGRCPKGGGFPEGGAERHSCQARRRVLDPKPCTENPQSPLAQVPGDALLSGGSRPLCPSDISPSRGVSFREGSLDDIISSLRNQKNGAKFSRLYDSGDFSDYGSQSEADLALFDIEHFCFFADRMRK